MVEFAAEEIPFHPQLSHHFTVMVGFFSTEFALGFTGFKVEFALSRGGRVLLADEMGLGKTAQATYQHLSTC